MAGLTGPQYIPEEWDSDKYKNVEAEFKDGADIQEGVGGRTSIDTTYENTSTTEVQNPRSERNEGKENHNGPEREYRGY